MPDDTINWQPLPTQGGGIDWQPLPAAAQDSIGPLTDPKQIRALKEIGGGGTVDNRQQGASVGQNIHASLFPNVNDQIQSYANARGIPTSLYGVVNGNIVYLNNEGQLVRETPSVVGATGPLDAFARAIHWMGSNARTLTDQAAGGVAGAATGGNPLAAGGAAAATDAGLQTVGQLTNGNPSITDSLGKVSLSNAAGQGLLNAGGQLAGNLIGGVARSVYDTNPLKAMGYDAELLNDPANRAQWSAVGQKAQNMGITLTPGEMTGAKSLLANQRQLGRMDNVGSGSKSPMDILGDMYANRSGVQIPDAVQNIAASLSPNPGIVGRANFQNGAQGVIDSLIKARKDASAPLYQSVVNADTMVSPETYVPLAQDPFMSGIIQSVRSDPLTGLNKLQPNSLPVLDAVKKRLDDMIGTAQRSGENWRASLLTGKKNDMLSAIDAEIPNYAVARDAYAGMSPEVKAAQNGVIGAFANGTADLSDLIRTGNSMDIINARQDFERAGQQDAWSDALRAHVEDVLNKAQTVNVDAGVGNVAGKINKGLAANPQQVANLRAALGDPEKVQAVQDLTDVLSRAAKAPPEGSPTATDLGKNGQNLASPGVRLFSRLLNLGSPFDVAEKAGDYMVNRSGANNAAALAQMITDPNAWQTLQKMRMMDPGSAAYIQTGTKLLNDVGYQGWKPEPADRAPADASR